MRLLCVCNYSKYRQYFLNVQQGDENAPRKLYILYGCVPLRRSGLGFLICGVPFGQIHFQISDPSNTLWTRIHRRVVTRYMGIRDQRLKKGWDQGSQPRIRDHSPRGSGSACFPLTQGSTQYTGINKISWDQGSKFSSLLGSGIKNLRKNTGSAMKKYTSLRPCHRITDLSFLWKEDPN